jgi:hypothetical protein
VSYTEVQIIHGDIESAEEMAGLEAVHKAAQPFWQRTHGTNDTTTLVITPDGLRPVLGAISANRRAWWKVTVTSGAVAL